MEEIKDETPFSLTYQSMLNRFFETPKHKLSDDDRLMDKIIRVVKDFNEIKETELFDMKNLIEKSEFKKNLQNHLKLIESDLKQKGYDY